MRTKAGQRQDSVWSYLLEPTDDGCLLVHHFRMGKATEASSHHRGHGPGGESGDSSAEWSAKLAGDLAATLDRIKVVIEKE